MSDTNNETNTAIISVRNNQRRIEPATEWYYTGGRTVTFTQGNDYNTRVYGTSSLAEGINNTSVAIPFYGRVSLNCNSPTNFTQTVYYSDGTSTTSSVTSTNLFIGIVGVESGSVIASNQTITSGNYDESVTYTVSNIPIFREGDTEAIENYLNSGDDSGALNYELLHSSPVDYYLTNNGDRIELKWVGREGKKPLVKSTTITMHSDIPDTEDYFDFFQEDIRTTTWDKVISSMRGLLPTNILINSLEVEICAYDNEYWWKGSKYCTLKARMTKGSFGTETTCVAIVQEDNGYTLHCATDNRFDDIGIGSDDESNAGDNNNDGSGFGGFDNLTSTYKLTKQALSDLGSFIWKNDAFDNIKLFNNSPIENIVACHYMPINIGGQNNNVVLGNVTTNVSGELLSQNMKKINVASFVMPKVNTGFLGYEPYTSVSLYLPLVGMIDLQPNDVCGYTVTIDYAFDVVCGSFGVMVYTSKGGGKTLLYSSQGNCSVTIPLTASNQSQVQSSILTSGVSLVADAFSGNPMRAISDVEKIALHQNHSTTFGSPSSMVGALSPNLCYYIIRTPIIYMPSNFAHTKGFICLNTYKMSELQGFTKLTNDVDLSGFIATEKEKEELKNILTSGFYL